MSHKKRGQLTTSPEWLRHLRPLLRRWFWKGERRAERDLIRTEPERHIHRPISGTVENLIREVESWGVVSSTAELWVPEHLTLEGEPVPQDIAMAIVCDKLLSLEVFPKGFSPGLGGRLYRYTRK